MMWPWRTLRGRLALASTVGLLAASIAFAVLGVELVRSQTVAEEVADLESKARGIAGLMGEDANRAIQSAEGVYNPSPDRIKRFESIAGIGTELLYKPYADLTPGRPTTLKSPALDQVKLDVLEDVGLQRFDYRDPTSDRPRIAAAAPVSLGEDIVGAAVLTRERAAVASVWRRIANRVLFAAGIGLLFALVVSTLLTRRVLRPLARFQTAAVSVGQGDLQTRVKLAGTDEIDTLATAFNRMVEELHHREQLGRDFLMRVTHDLRTPLTAIRGHTQALTDGVVPEDAVPRSLAAIDHESERLEALVTDLLDLAKLEARRFRLELDEVDGDELIDRAFFAYSGEAARRGITYERIGEPLPSLFTDAARVRQVISNLLDNAFRWTPDGGTITLGAVPREVGKGAVVTVSDTGPGISPDELEGIFEAFRSQDLPDGRHGSGLGLAISRQLARALGGDLTVTSTLGEGATFTLELSEEPRMIAQPPER